MRYDKCNNLFTFFTVQATVTRNLIFYMLSIEMYINASFTLLGLLNFGGSK